LSSISKKSGSISVPDPGISGLENSESVKYFIVLKD
jgi:hypothetical protein